MGLENLPDSRPLLAAHDSAARFQELILLARFLPGQLDTLESLDS